MIEFFASIGGICVLFLLLYLLFNHEDQKTHNANELRDLLKYDDRGIKEYEKLCATERLTELQALKLFYKDEKDIKKALSNKNKHKEYEALREAELKKDMTLKRIYAYKYEDFVFSLCSPFAEFDDYKQEWYLVSSFQKFTKDFLVLEIIDYFHIDWSQAECLLNEFVKNQLFDNYLICKDYSIGRTLTSYANIVSSVDCNIDKWIKKHGQTRTKEEMLAYIEDRKLPF